MAFEWKDIIGRGGSKPEDALKLKLEQLQHALSVDDKLDVLGEIRVRRWRYGT